jgi:hypothetical protein
VTAEVTELLSVIYMAMDDLVLELSKQYEEVKINLKISAQTPHLKLDSQLPLQHRQSARRWDS